VKREIRKFEGIVREIGGNLQNNPHPAPSKPKERVFQKAQQI
jgi:hypothetical protein